MSLYMPFIECLPQETTGEIFKHLPLKDAAHCEQLCKLAQEIILKQDCPLTQGKDLIARIKMCDNLLSGQSQLKRIEREAKIFLITLGLFIAAGIDFSYTSPYTYVAKSTGVVGAVCALTAATTAQLFIKNNFEIKKNTS